MRVAFTFLTYGKNVFGGIENALFNLTKGLSENGHEVFVFTSKAYINGNTSDLPAEVFVSDNLPGSYDGHVSNLISYLKNNSAKINLDFDRFISQYSPDFVVVVDPIWGILQVTGYIYSIKIPTAVWYHIANKWPETQEIMRNSFTAPYKKNFAVSDFLIDDIKNSFSESKGVAIKVLPNSINPDLYSVHPEEKENFIFCNSRIAKGKDVDVLVKAFKIISAEHSIALKLCSGRFPFGETSADLNEIELLVKQLGLSKNVEFLPPLNWGEVPNITMRSKMLVLPSRYETFGIAALEASVAGVPLIAAEATNFKSLVKDSALFFEPGNIEDLASKINEVLHNYHTYEERAVRSIENYTKYYNKKVASDFINEISNNNM